MSSATPAPVVISYLRFSRPEQLKGDSMRRQLELGDRWAAAHGVTIADSFRDLGISAFRGANATEGNLSHFLRFVDEGRVPPGSTLLIEQLDRLSRNALLDALELFLSIIRRGIRIVTLMDGQEYDRASLSRNMSQLQYSIMMMSLAHEESAKKSERLAHAWNGKRLKIADRPLTGQLPAWVKLHDGKIVVDDEKVVIVRRIVALALEGFGLDAITKKMNASGTGLARVPYLNRSYVSKILHNRATLGEFQPHKVKYVDGRKRREPVGEPVQNYFPAIISEDQFYAVQRQLASRRGTGGRQHSFTNLFLGLLFDRADGSTIQVNDKGYGRRYVSSAALLGRKGASGYVGFPVTPFERIVLLQLHDFILPHFADSTAGTDARLELEAIDGRIGEARKQISDTQDAMLDAKLNTSSVVAMLAKLDTKLKRLQEQKRDISGELSTRANADIDDAVATIAKLLTFYRKGSQAMTPDERVKVRNIVRLVVDRIEVTFSRHGLDYHADVFLSLRDGATFSVKASAMHVNRMKRNAKGHPIGSGAKGPPQYTIGVDGARCLRMGSLSESTMNFVGVATKLLTGTEVLPLGC